MTESKRPVCDDAGESGSPRINESFREGLSLLLQACSYAQDAGAALWDFALEIDTLYEQGLTVSELRWLVAKGFALHGQETSVYGDAHRAFRPSQGLNFLPTTCFVLTPGGIEFADQVLNQSSN